MNDDGGLYIHAKCHISAPTWTFIKGEMATIICSECKAPIVSLKLESNEMLEPVTYEEGHA